MPSKVALHSREKSPTTRATTHRIIITSITITVTMLCASMLPRLLSISDQSLTILHSLRGTTPTARGLAQVRPCL